MSNGARKILGNDGDDGEKKKPRFDPLHPEFIRADNEEEADEFEEDIGMSRTGAKRRKVRTDGYDSDSSQEGDRQRNKKKKKKAAPAKTNEDDDDMFNEASTLATGDEEEEVELDAKGKPKKEVKFVDYTNFEGQEISDNERDVEDEEESVPSTPGQSEDEEIIDAEEVGPAGLKGHKAPKIERYNLKQEQSEGVFTEDGTYVRKAADPRAHQDVWMQGLTKGQIDRARKAKEKMEQRAAEEAEKRDDAMGKLTSNERLERLIRCLKPGETPLEALARLNQG